MSRRLRREEPGTPSAVALRRARVWMGALVTATVVLTLGSSLVARLAFPESPGILVAAFFGVFIPPFVPLLCGETRGLLVGHGPQETLLSAVTPTGPRTIDLDAITRVRGYFLPGRFGKSVDLLIVTDAHGVRIGLSSIEARAAVREALARAAARAPDSPAKVGRNARRRLSGKLSVARDVLLPMVLVPVCIVGGFVLCMAVAGA